MKNPLHRKRLYLYLQTLCLKNTDDKTKEEIRNLEQIDNHWVISKFIIKRFYSLNRKLNLVEKLKNGLTISVYHNIKNTFKKPKSMGLCSII